MGNKTNLASLCRCSNASSNAVAMQRLLPLEAVFISSRLLQQHVVALAAGKAGQLPLQPLLERHPSVVADRHWCREQYWLLGFVVEVDSCTQL
jgi:hypothetical protein